jgi:hypothetical protein
MGSVQFSRQGNAFVLKVRRSCQASIAEFWLQNYWNIRTQFKLGRWWYVAQLPGELPPELEAKLRARAKEDR